VDEEQYAHVDEPSIVTGKHPCERAQLSPELSLALSAAPATSADSKDASSPAERDALVSPRQNGGSQNYSSFR
jgi:hypothetical protein